MAEHNFEDMEPIDALCTGPTAIQATSDQIFNPRCAHNPMPTECIQSQYPNFNHNFALPQFMAPPNSEDLDSTVTPNSVPTTLQASCDHIFNPRCAYNLMETQCIALQYLIPHLCSYPIWKSEQQSQPLQLFGFPIPTRPWGASFEKDCYSKRRAGFPSEMVQVRPCKP